MRLWEKRRLVRLNQKRSMLYIVIHNTAAWTSSGEFAFHLSSSRTPPATYEDIWRRSKIPTKDDTPLPKIFLLVAKCRDLQRQDLPNRKINGKASELIRQTMELICQQRRSMSPLARLEFAQPSSKDRLNRPTLASQYLKRFDSKQSIFFSNRPFCWIDYDDLPVIVTTESHTLPLRNRIYINLLSPTTCPPGVGAG